MTAMLEEGLTPEGILELVLGEFGVEIMDRMNVSFQCNCSRERVEKVLLSLGKKELQELVDEGKEVELHCHFCNKRYVFPVEEVEELMKTGESSGRSKCLD